MWCPTCRMMWAALKNPDWDLFHQLRSVRVVHSSVEAAFYQEGLEEPQMMSVKCSAKGCGWGISLERDLGFAAGNRLLEGHQRFLESELKESMS